MKTPTPSESKAGVPEARHNYTASDLSRQVGLVAPELLGWIALPAVAVLMLARGAR